MKKDAKGRKQVSGAVGGPATGMGMNYQMRYALVRLLDLISRALAAPLSNASVRMERRAVAGNNVTRWDIGIETNPALLIEVKLNPSRADVLDWLQRSAAAANQGGNRVFQLTFAEGGGPLLKAARRLISIAKEAEGDDEFQSLVREEAINDAGEILSVLGDNPLLMLRRMIVSQVSEDSLVSDVENRARQLAGSAAGQDLVHRLFCKISDAVETRGTISVTDTILELRADKVPLQGPPVISASDLSLPIQNAVYLLQQCEFGLPLSVLAAAVRLSVSDLDAELEPLRAAKVLAQEEEIVRLQPLPSELTHPDEQALLARAVDGLVTYIISADPAEARGQSQQVLSLASRCLRDYPKVVASVFPRLDKALKRLGDKRLVLDVADMSIGAARHERDRAQAEAEIRSLICGRAWVLQRIGDLAGARLALTTSLEQARALGANVNLAFGTKCLGRIARLEAELLPPGKQDVGLRESAELLESAIVQFSSLPDYGDIHPEVGDCYSLLARTYLVGRHPAKANEAIGKAQERLNDPREKDYLDLQILMGDFEASQGDFDAADRYYKKVIDVVTPTDPERSEMIARAHLQSGRNDLRRNGRVAAQRHFEAASKIWRELDEVTAAAVPEWELVLMNAPSADFLRAVEGRPLSIRVGVWNRDERRRTEAAKTRNARRNEPSRIYWDQLIAAEEQESAVKLVHW
ncbi:MAG TPA: hypothetical protein VGB92_11875 [Longimicrobium sp.]|jgi:tetratricopeptide (TPR) repeat protein